MTSIYFLVAGVTFVFIALRAFQQLNVMHGKFALVPPTSYAMAFCEVFMIGAIAHGGNWIMALAMGTGGSMGAVCSMWLHKKVRG